PGVAVAAARAQPARAQVRRTHRPPARRARRRACRSPGGMSAARPPEGARAQVRPTEGACAMALPADFAPRLIAWQASHGRHGLPWQGTHDPYRVWLSEIMLQQTQVSTVLN